MIKWRKLKAGQEKNGETCQRPSSTRAQAAQIAVIAIRRGRRPAGAVADAWPALVSRDGALWR